MSFSQPGAWILIAGLVLIALVFQGRRYHESANRVVEDCCRQNGLQLLDGTIAFAGLRLLPGRFRLCRAYRFEYSIDGTDRFEGHIVLYGDQPVTFHIDPDHLAARTIH